MTWELNAFLKMRSRRHLILLAVRLGLHIGNRLASDNGFYTVMIVCLGPKVSHGDKSLCIDTEVLVTTVRTDRDANKACRKLCKGLLNPTAYHADENALWSCTSQWSRVTRCQFRLVRAHPSASNSKTDVKRVWSRKQNSKTWFIPEFAWICNVYKPHKCCKYQHQPFPPPKLPPSHGQKPPVQKEEGWASPNWPRDSCVCCRYRCL